MIVYNLTLAGANQFTGVDVNTGLVDFTADYNFGADVNIAPKIFGYSYNNGAGTADITIDLFEPAGAATSSVVLHDVVGRSNLFRSCNPPLIVPRTAAVIWQARCVTLNKAAAATFLLWWGPGRVE